MGDVGEQERAVLLGDLTEAGEVDFAGVRGSADGDHLGLLTLSHLFDFVVVDAAVSAHAVVNSVVELAGEVRGVAVREVATMRQVHGQDFVAGLDAREVDGGISLAAGVRLDVGVVSTEQGLGAVDSQLLDLVDDFATAVPALTGITFGVLIGEDAALGFHDGGKREVLGRNQLDVRLLALELGLNQAVDLRIKLGERDAANGGHSWNGERANRARNRGNGKSAGLSTWGLQLIHAPGMPAGFEFGGQEGLDARQGGREVDVFGPKTKDISVVMATALASGVGALDEGGPNAAHLVGSDGDANAGRADEDTELCATADDIGGHRMGVVRIVAGGLGLGTAIEDGVTLGLERFNQAASQGESAVVTAKGKRKRAGHRERFWRRNSTIAGMASTMESRHSS